MATTLVTRTIIRRLAVAVSLSLFGLVGLPLIFGGLPDPTPAIVWLALAIAIGVCLIPTLAMLANPLADVLLRLPVHGLTRSSANRATAAVARLTLAVIYLLLLQAILRHPLIAVFGANAEPFAIEAWLAVSAMLVISILIVWLHSSVAPLIESLARTVLDAGLATSSDEDSAPSSTAQHAAAFSGPEPHVVRDTVVTPGQSSMPASTVVDRP